MLRMYRFKPVALTPRWGLGLKKTDVIPVDNTNPVRMEDKLMVIAVCGARRSGKDTICDRLCSHHGFIKASFATPIKAMVREAFGFTNEQLENHAKDEVDARYGITPRRALQFLGTEVMQYQLQQLLPQMGREFWSKRLVDKYIGPVRGGSTPSSNKVVISDMRFLHEYDAVREAVRERHGVLQVWHVERANNPMMHHDVNVDSHASETEWRAIPKFLHLSNDATIDALYQKVDAAV